MAEELKQHKDTQTIENLNGLKTSHYLPFFIGFLLFPIITSLTHIIMSIFSDWNKPDKFILSVFFVYPSTAIVSVIGCFLLRKRSFAYGVISFLIAALCLHELGIWQFDGGSSVAPPSRIEWPLF